MLIRKPNSGYLLLRETIKKKNKRKARNLIRSNASVNIPNTKDNTPLHWAIIKFDDLDIMKMLLAEGANIHAKNHRRQKPLDVAIHFNKTEAAVLLIRRGALVRADLNALLLVAIEQKNVTIVKSIIDHAIKFMPLIDLKIPLKVAISQGQSKVMEHILPHCQFFRSSDQYIPKEVVISSSPQYKECVQLLLKWNFIVSPDSNQDEDFVYGAVKNGYLKIVLQLLKLGIDVNLVNSKTGLNLLKVACLHQYHEIVEILLKHNACVNLTTPISSKLWTDLLYYHCNNQLYFIFYPHDSSDVTCLHIAVSNSDPKMTKLLLKYGAKIIDDPTFVNITRTAILRNCEEIVRIFLDHGVNVNDIDFEGKSLLHFCVLNNEKEYLRYKIAKLLLENGANINIQSPGNSLLFEAIKRGHQKIAQLFLNYNADVQYSNLDGNTLLHEAIENLFDVEFIKTLLKRNSPVNAVNKAMRTPLHVACTMFSYKLEIIGALLSNNANVNCTDEDMMTPLHFACQDHRLGVVAALLEKGANPNAKDNEGQTPFHFVCKQKYLYLASYLAITDTYATTLRIIQLLLQHGANIETVDANGWTPLFHACKANSDIVVKWLLDNNANANHIDLEKLSPLYIAVQNSVYHYRTAKILLEHKVNAHVIDKWGNSIIHVVVDNNASELIEDLARTQINFNTINKKGNTPLHIAVKKQSVEMVKNLIKYGANVNILDKNYQTALYNAIDYHNRHPDSYCDNTIKFQEIIKILEIQVIKLKIAGLKVNIPNLYLVNGSHDNETSEDESSDKDDYNYENCKAEILKFEVDCEREIEKMRTENIGVNNMTFYDLLTKNIHFLSRFVKNKKIRQTLELEEYDQKFPLYMDIVRSRFRDAKLRYRIMNSAR